MFALLHCSIRFTWSEHHLKSIENSWKLKEEEEEKCSRRNRNIENSDFKAVILANWLSSARCLRCFFVSFLMVSCRNWFNCHFFGNLLLIIIICCFYLLHSSLMYSYKPIIQTITYRSWVVQFASIPVWSR